MRLLGLALIVCLAIAIQMGWSAVTDWIEPAPQHLQAVKLPGLLLSLVFVLSAARWIRARDKE
ncbi:hypothetical protein DYI42_08765 [Vannielia litorea]|nr:hypothetical protein [Vannielia litorea]